MSELPKGWASPGLAEICTFNPKHDPETDRDQHVSFVPMPAVSDERGSIETPQDRPLSEIWKGYTHFQDGDVIFAKITPCMENGKSAVASDLTNGLACGSTEFHVLRPEGGILPDYIWRFVRQVDFRKDAEAHMTGAVGQRRVPKTYLEKHPIPLPPLREQRRIVRKLDTLSARTSTARAHFTAIAKLVERYRTQVLQAALSGVYTVDWRLKNPTPETTAVKIVGECKENCISVRRSKQPTRNLVPPESVPLDWGFERGQDLCSVIVDGTHHTPTYVDDGVPFISVKDVRNGKVYFDACKYISNEEHAELSKRCAPKTGDVLITKSGTIGRLAVLREVPDFSLFVSVAMIRPASPKLAPNFLAYALENWVRSINISAEITGSTIKNLHLQDIKALGFPIPSFEEQCEIVHRIEAAFAKIDRLAAEAEKALKLTDRLDQRIFAKAFAGELVPQDPTDEPASVLLNCIREERRTKPKPKRGRRKKVEV